MKSTLAAVRPARLRSVGRVTGGAARLWFGAVASALAGGALLALAWVWPAPDAVAIRGGLAVIGAGYLALAVACAWARDAGGADLAPAWVRAILTGAGWIGAGLARLAALACGALALTAMFGAAQASALGFDALALGYVATGAGLAFVAWRGLAARLETRANA